MTNRRSSARTAVPALMMGAALLVGCSSNADSVDHQAAAQDLTETTTPVTQEELAAIASLVDLCFANSLTQLMTVAIDTGANKRAFELPAGQQATESTCARFDTYDDGRPPVGAWTSQGSLATRAHRWQWKAINTFMLGRATTEVIVAGESCPDKGYLYISQTGQRQTTTTVCGVTFTMADSKDIGFLLTASAKR